MIVYGGLRALGYSFILFKADDCLWRTESFGIRLYSISKLMSEKLRDRTGESFSLNSKILRLQSIPAPFFQFVISPSYQAKCFVFPFILKVICTTQQAIQGVAT